MRVRFGSFSEREASERAQAINCARRAWELVASGRVDAARELLARIDGALELWRDDETSCLALAALEPSRWPLAELLLEQAPPELPFSLSLGKPPLPLARALGEVEREHGVVLGRGSLRAGFGRGHLLEITLGVPGGVGAEIEQIAAEDLVRSVLGDRLFETWVGAVHASAEPRLSSLRVLDARAPRSKLQLSELFETVAAAARGVLSGLPDQSFAERARAALDPEWTMLEVEPLPDARGGRKDDLLLASTCTPELLRCFLDGSPCASARFSRCGERFVFVSYPDEGPLTDRLTRRGEVESALTLALADVGAVIGVGLGARYTYVDLALCHLASGLERLVSALRTLGLPRGSFVHFVDSELREESLTI